MVKNRDDGMIREALTIRQVFSPPMPFVIDCNHSRRLET